MTSLEWKLSKAKRRMQRRREKHTAMRIAYKLSAVVLLMGAAVMFSGAAQQSTETVRDVHVVQAGDTLWNLTEKYREKDARNLYIMEYMNEIKELNPEVADGKIYPGQEISFEYRVNR